MNFLRSPFKLKPVMNRSLTGAAVLLSATTLINAGESKAATFYSCTFGDLSGCENKQLFDKLFFNFSVSGGASPNSTIDIFEFDGNFIVSTAFKPPIGGGSSVSGSLAYDVEIQNPFNGQNYTFKSLSLDSSFNPGSTTPGGSTVATTIIDKDTSLNAIVGDPVITSTNGAPVPGVNPPILFKSSVTKISGTSVFNTTPGGSLSGFSLSFFQEPKFIRPPEGVPGPLPLLGAGAAFGFSRRLRRRVKAAAA